ncbi:MAG: DMT family transporter [Nanoarchaeota archaeon]|nr:DMT family transporter [Nanoarchaeota archaeon]
MKEETKGEITIFISTLLFAITAILVKFVSSSFNAFFIALFRFIMGILLGVFLILLTRRRFKLYDKKILLLRSFFGSIAMILYYTSIQITSSGRATLLTYTYPIFVALYGYIFFKQYISMKTILSIFICIFGILLVFYDGSSYSMLGNSIGLLAGMFSGMAVHYIKKSRERNDPITVYLVACIFGFFVTLFSVKQATSINISSLIMLIALGTVVFIGQMFMTYGYKHVQATTGAIISFLTVPLAIFFSYFIGEEMTIKFFIGAALVILGIIINQRKKIAILQ